MAAAIQPRGGRGRRGSARPRWILDLGAGRVRGVHDRRERDVLHRAAVVPPLRGRRRLRLRHDGDVPEELPDAALLSGRKHPDRRRFLAHRHRLPDANARVRRERDLPESRRDARSTGPPAVHRVPRHHAHASLRRLDRACAVGDIVLAKATPTSSTLSSGESRGHGAAAVPSTCSPRRGRRVRKILVAGRDCRSRWPTRRERG